MRSSARTTTSSSSSPVFCAQTEQTKKKVSALMRARIRHASENVRFSAYAVAASCCHRRFYFNLLFAQRHTKSPHHRHVAYCTEVLFVSAFGTHATQQQPNRCAQCVSSEKSEMVFKSTLFLWTEHDAINRWNANALLFYVRIASLRLTLLLHFMHKQRRE